MDESMQPLVEMGVSLTELAVKGFCCDKKD